MKEVGRVGILAAGNLLLASAATVIDKITQVAHLLLVAGQVGVATVTIIYIIKKIRALSKRKPPK